MPVLTYLEAIRQGIAEEMDRDPTVFCIGEDIGIYGGAFKITEGFIDRFGPERVIDSRLPSPPSSARRSAPLSPVCARWPNFSSWTSLPAP